MRIKLSGLASYKLEKLLEFLESEWSVQSKNQFFEKLTARFEKLKQYPLSNPASNIRPELRKLVVTMQTTALYKIEGDVIYIVTIFDNRQNPAKIDEEIRRNFV